MEKTKNDTISTSLHESLQARVAPLLNLPLELFLQIWDSLPLYTQCSLSLTCRSLYVSYGICTLPHLSLDSSHSRTCRSYFLRLLRRDLANSLQWLCYDCLTFHPHSPTQHARDSHVILLGGRGKRDPIQGRPLHLPCGSGFPYCNSAFTLSRDYIASLLESGDDARPTVYKGSNSIKSSTYTLSLDYTIKLDVGFQGLETWTEYVYDTPYEAFQRQTWSSVPANEHTLSPEQLTNFLFRTNHEFCPHLWFGEDFTLGDGSMSARLKALLETRAHVQDLPSFECMDCHVYVDVRMVFRGTVQIRVCQYYKPEALKVGMRPGRLDGWEWDLVRNEPQEIKKQEKGLRGRFWRWRS